MNEADVVEILGGPTAIIPRSQMMTSRVWKCSHCQKVSTFDIPVSPPAPCTCNGIAFEKLQMVLQ